MRDDFDLFDCHLHIIDRRFPLVANNGFIPEEFNHQDYLNRLSNYHLIGGAVVSGSFQGFDQRYLVAALAALGPGFVGVTQLPKDVTDSDILRLQQQGVRALRFNLKRGGSEGVRHLSAMASRVYELASWHVELYVDGIELELLYPMLVKLPAVSIDHMGLTKAGMPVLLDLAEKGVKVKATGFGRVDFDVKLALRDLYTANPRALMFGTDLPSTRAPQSYRDNDFSLVVEALGPESARDVTSRNALEFYRINR